ncbi:MAG: competence protein ComK [Bacilli bacterium]|nr:competence protein ComK [Bacilli bacterium]
MENYEINSDTVALIPKEDKTIVYEVDKSFVVDKKPLEIMEESCEYFGSSLEGRQQGVLNIAGYTHKVPVIVEESFDLIFFPTLSPRNKKCSWLSYRHIIRPDKFKDKSIIELKNGKKILLDVSCAIIDNQMYRCSRIEDILKVRKIQNIEKKATKR